MAAGALCRAAKLLRPQTAVALLNGEIDATDLSAPCVFEDGSLEDSTRALQAVGVQLVTPVTGVPVRL